MLKRLKINKKEKELAFTSALSATANNKEIIKRYSRLDEKDLKGLPMVVESKIVSLKTKDLISSLKKILGDKLFELAMRKKIVRAGKGKIRGRKTICEHCGTKEKGHASVDEQL